MPHRGADLAFWAGLATDAVNFASLGAYGNPKFVEALKRKSPEFMRISMGFIQPGGNFSVIRTFYETVRIKNQLVSSNHLQENDLKLTEVFHSRLSTKTLQHLGLRKSLRFLFRARIISTSASSRVWNVRSTNLLGVHWRECLTW